MAREQRVIFTIKQATDGRMMVSMEFYPKVAKTIEDWNKLPIHIQRLQGYATGIGKFAMEAMMKQDTKAAAAEGLEETK